MAKKITAAESTISSPAGTEYLPLGIVNDATAYRGQIRDLSPLANVKYFGAVGNGTTDDSVAIQAAIDSLTSGGRVVLPAATYMGQGLTVPSDVQLIGLGYAVIKLVANADQHLIKNSDQVSGNSRIKLKDLWLDGNRANQTLGLSANTSHAIYMLKVAWLHLENVHVINCIDNGFKLDECTDLYLRNCGIDGAGTDGWSIDNCQRVQGESLYAKNADGKDADGTTDRPGAGTCYGFEIEDNVSELNLRGIFCADCNRAGAFNIQNHNTDGSNENLTLSDLVIRDSTLAFNLSGHASQKTIQTTITNLVVDACHRGIRLANLVGVTIQGFQIDASETAVGTDYGIWFDGDCADVTLANGKVIANESGVQIDASLTLARVRFANVEVEVLSGGTGAACYLQAVDADLTWTGGSLVNNGTGRALDVFANQDPPARFTDVYFYAADTSGLSSGRAVVYLGSSVSGLELYQCTIRGDNNPHGLVKGEGTNHNNAVVNCELKVDDGGTLGPGIAFDNGGNDNRIAGNRFDGCSNGSIIACSVGNGLRAQAEGNRFINCNRCIYFNCTDGLATGNVTVSAAVGWSVNDVGTNNTVANNKDV